MDPSNKTPSGFELPAPGIEQGLPDAPTGAVEVLPGIPEQAPAVAEKEPVLQPPASAPPLPAVPQPTATGAPLAAVSATTDSATLTADDDDDLIEKAWVEKAKQIVERTRDDPFRQSEELTVFKADYMKKRYGKAIKVSQ